MEVWLWLKTLGWRDVLTTLYALTIMMAVWAVVMEQRNPQKATIWVLVLLLLPGVGLLLYMFFGQSGRLHRYHRKERVDLALGIPLGEEQTEESPSYSHFEAYALHMEQVWPYGVREHENVVRLLWYNSHSLVMQGNDTELYQEGEAAFASLLRDLQEAQHSIDMEFYIFSAVGIGMVIGEVLLQRAQEGVRVRLIYDDVGSWRMPRSFRRRLKEGGVQLAAFHPVLVPWLSTRVNYRNHRKIVVIDGRYAHMGGMNVADKYMWGDRYLGEWHDTQIRIHGPAVWALHRVFLSDWEFVTQESPPESDPLPYFDPLPGDKNIQVVASGPDSDWASIMQAFFLVIARALRYIYICTPYFVPNQAIITALSTAALSGVDVRILLPSKSDSRMVLWATYGYISQLLEAGIRVYLFEGGFNHSKVMMVDGELSTIGSANMDIRSFESNFEVVSFIYNSDVTGELERKFIADCLRSKNLTLSSWRVRPTWRRMLHNVARLFSPLF